MGGLSEHERTMLKNVPMFSALSDEQLDTLAGQSSRVQFGPHEVICRQGDEALFFHVILTGHVRLFEPRPDGAISNGRILGPGQAFGETEALKGHPHTADAEAMDDVLLLAIQGDSFNSILRSHVEVVSDLVAGLTSRLQDLARLADGPGPDQSPPPPGRAAAARCRRRRVRYLPDRSGPPRPPGPHRGGTHRVDPRRTPATRTDRRGRILRPHSQPPGPGSSGHRPGRNRRTLSCSPA
jgi:CRP-like cAMP-binding protein